MQITITIDDDATPEQIEKAIKAAQEAIQPSPDKYGYCKCPEDKRDVIATGLFGYCRRCGGAWY